MVCRLRLEGRAESDEFKQRQEKFASWDGVSPAVEMPPKREIDMITTQTFGENDTQVSVRKIDVTTDGSGSVVA